MTQRTDTERCTGRESNDTCSNNAATWPEHTIPKDECQKFENESIAFRVHVQTQANRRPAPEGRPRLAGVKAAGQRLKFFGRTPQAARK